MSLEPLDEIQFVRLDALKPWAGNPRSITDEAMRMLRDALRHDPGHLIGRPLQATPDGTVYAGNMRLAAIAQEREKLAGGSTLIQQLDAWGGIPVFVDDCDEKTMIERAVRDNQAYGEWEDEQLAGLLVGYEEEFDGTARLLGIHAEEEARLTALVAAARAADEAPPAPIVEVPEVEERRRVDAWAVTITFAEKDDRDRFAVELRDAGHEHVQAHVGRWDEG